MKPQDISGKKFGRLTALSLCDGHTPSTPVKWNCVCDCGNLIQVLKASLKTGNTKSCGCLSKEKAVLTGRAKRKDLAGKKFGKLTVTEYHHSGPRGNSLKKTVAYWLCQCDCGEKKVLNTGILYYAKSCGCEQYKLQSQVGEVGFNSLYQRYQSIAEQRDLNFSLSLDDFRNLTSKNCFYCDLPPSKISGYSPGSSKQPLTIENSKYVYNGIDRIDNNLGYILENCVPCCTPCNLAKKDFTLVDFTQWVERLYKSLKAKGRI